MVTRTLAVRLDSAGDVLLAGPALRAVAAAGDTLTLLAGPLGVTAAGLLPGVEDVWEWRCPWIVADPPAVDRDDVAAVVTRVAAGRFDRALVLTSFHQSPLPTALLLRLAGVPWVGAVSVDYPGSLLDLRHRVDESLPEAERALSLVRAAGYELPEGDTGELRVRRPLPEVDHLVPDRGYVVLHPGTSVPARAWPVQRFREAAQLLAEAGHAVVVTGARSESGLTAQVADGSSARDLGGRTSLAELAGVLDGAGCVVVANTGPAHLAAAVGAPVVSLFAPTVPAERWAPYRVPSVLLGDQQAPCRDTRATRCPVPGHPCLTSVSGEDVVAAVDKIVDRSLDGPRTDSGGGA
jgi:ADP-heptose:LPS heptosyltransferase